MAQVDVNVVKDWKEAKESAPEVGSFKKESVDAVRLRLLDKKVPLPERFRCVFTLRNVATDQAIDALCDGFVDESSDLLKHEIAYVLGQIQSTRPVPKLIEILADKTECAMVRHEAGEALGAIGDVAALEALKKYAQDSVVEVAETCQLAIDLIEWRQKQKKEQETVSKNPYASVDPAPPCMVDEEKDVAKLREQLLNTKKPLFKRYRAMFSLRNIGSDEAALAIADSLSDTSALLRHEAAYVLGQMQNQAVVEQLIAVVDRETEEPMVRHEAAESLGAIGSRRAMDRLKELTKDRHRVVKESCVVALDIMDYYDSNSLEYADALQKPSPASKEE